MKQKYRCYLQGWKYWCVDTKTGEDLPAHQPGELIFKADYIMKGKRELK